MKTHPKPRLVASVHRVNRPTKDGARVIMGVCVALCLATLIGPTPARAQPQTLCDLPTTGTQWCAPWQTQQCWTTATNTTCLPREIRFPVAGGPPEILVCSCFDNTGACGPVDIEPNPFGIGFTVSCPGPCAIAGQECELFFNGSAQGYSSTDSSRIPVNTRVTCDCVVPNPNLCPLADSWCKALQTLDCPSTSPLAETCLPKQVGFDPYTGQPIIDRCACFNDVPGCGPVSIRQIGTTYIAECLGPCPNAADPCEVHVNGVPRGVSTIDLSSLAPGETVSCACVVPPPAVCPLPAAPECSTALQAQDCLTTGTCVPKVIRHYGPLPSFPPAGTDTLTPTTGYFVIIDSLGGESIYTIRESPPNVTKVARANPRDSGLNHVIDTEIVQLELVGVSGGGGGAGGALVHLNTARRSLGQVTRPLTRMNDYPADSFFDIFVTIDLPGFGVTGLYNSVPIRLEAQGVTAVPPLGSSFKTPATWQPVELLYPGGVGSHLYISRVVHNPPPPPPPWEVIKCQCIDPTNPNSCHITQPTTADPICTGGCPPGQECVQKITVIDQNTQDYSCECVQILCPMPTSQECAARQATDCQGTTGECLPKVIRHNTGQPFFPPTAGTDTLNSTTGYVKIRYPLGGGEELYTIRESPTSITSVVRGSPVPHDPDNYRSVATEITQLQLTGDGTSGRTVQIRESPSKASSGGIKGAISANTDFPADSFFDLFVEIDIPSLQVYGLRNNSPIRLEAPGITRMPPLGSSFKTPTSWQAVELLDANGDGTGYFIVEVRHDPPPPPPEWEVVQCQCMAPTACHVTRESSVEPTCTVGDCPAPQVCTQRITTGYGTVDYTCECQPARDHVVCELQGGNNPTHPPTYWYDVTTAWVTCDFHVKVLDPNPANYWGDMITPLPLDGNGDGIVNWKFSVHQLQNGEWWASWWTPGCEDPIRAPTVVHRFQFNHIGQNAWSDWRTTYSGNNEPYDIYTVDHSGNHTGEQNGYGYLVHVPTPPVATQACCLPDGTCKGLEYNRCVALGGDPQGLNTACTAVVCNPLKWAQPPTYGPAITPQQPCFLGWDDPSNYSAGPIVADDWACSTNQPITDIHWWGSYQGWTTRTPPPQGVGPTSFHIGIWTDVPPNDPGQPLPYSHPGKMIQQWTVSRSQLNEQWVGCDEFGTNFDMCFRYDFTITDSNQWFYQKPSTDPTVYWISISAIYTTMPPIQNPWGWKTREHFFNDDAVRIVAPTAPGLGASFLQGLPIENPTGKSWDMAFVLTTRRQAGIKWEQWPNPGWPGLHAADRITLADNWECAGGEVTDFHWWGNYELLGGQERRGAGIQCINLSIHKNQPGTPWCLPQDPAEWGVCALFSALHERDTGLKNSDGSKIYIYDFYLPNGYAQVPGEIYWLNIEAQSANPQDPAFWRWQENDRTSVPRLCPAAQRVPPSPLMWSTIPPWAGNPPLYSEMAFRVTSRPYPPDPDPTGVDKTRFISIAPGNPGGQTAIMVTLSSLHHPDPPYTGGTASDLTRFEGMARWVGPPQQFIESASSGVQFWASQTQCDPYYQDWSTVTLLHVTGPDIVPSSYYDVQTVSAACQGAETGCADVSTPLRIRTTRWGDVDIPYNPPPGTVQPDTTDISALVNKFKSALGAPIKARALLASLNRRGIIDIVPDMSFIHISACVDAFKGLAYPYNPGKCAGGLRACIVDADCTGSNCVGGTNDGEACNPGVVCGGGGVCTPNAPPCVLCP